MGLLVVAPAANTTIKVMVQDVADVIPRRTLGGDGLQAGTFTDETTPTAEQVARIIDEFVTDVTAAVPDLPAQLVPRARRVVALGAAAQIELAWFPEDASGAADKLEARYEQGLATLTRAVELATGANEPGGDGESGAAGEVVQVHAAGNFESPLSDLDVVLGRARLIDDPRGLLEHPMHTAWPYA